MASLQPFFPLDCNFNERVTAKSGSESGNGSTMPFDSHSDLFLEAMEEKPVMEVNIS